MSPTSLSTCATITQTAVYFMKVLQELHRIPRIALLKISKSFQSSIVLDSFEIEFNLQTWKKFPNFLCLFLSIFAKTFLKFSANAIINPFDANMEFYVMSTSSSNLSGILILLRVRRNESIYTFLEFLKTFLDLSELPLNYV